jgi:hypothetical protein
MNYKLEVKKLADAVVRSADESKCRGDDRCPFCQTVWVSSIDYKEHHAKDCLLLAAQRALDKV